MTALVLLHISQESRSVALKIYHQLRLGPMSIPGCFIDLARDIIYLSSNLDPLNDLIKPALKVEGLGPGLEAFQDRIHRFRLNQPLEIYEYVDGQVINTASYWPLIPTRHFHVIVEDLVHMDDQNQVAPRIAIDYRMAEEIDRWLEMSRYEWRKPRNGLPLVFEEPGNRWKGDDPTQNWEG